MLDKYSSTEIGSQEAELQEYFKIAIPRLLDYIEEHKITHILLLEKAARLFKAPLIRLFSELGMKIKVGSYAPDYYCLEWGVRVGNTREFEKQRDSQGRKLNFLKGGTDTKILVLDEFSETGGGLAVGKNLLYALGFNHNQIREISLDGNTNLHSTGLLEHIFYNRINTKLFNPYLRDDVHNGIFYARLNPNHPIPYKEIIRSLTRIILESTQ